jgi:hypothetical protein
LASRYRRFRWILFDPSGGFGTVSDRRETCEANRPIPLCILQPQRELKALQETVPEHGGDDRAQSNDRLTGSS